MQLDEDLRYRNDHNAHSYRLHYYYQIQTRQEQNYSIPWSSYTRPLVLYDYRMQDESTLRWVGYHNYGGRQCRARV